MTSFFIWTEVENQLESLLQRLNTFHGNLNLHTKNPKHQLFFQMLWSELTVIFLRQIFIVSPVIVISFLNLTLRIPYLSKNQLLTVLGYVLKDYVYHHRHLKNTLRVYVLGLGNVVTPRNLSTINLEGQQKTYQSSYLYIKRNMEPVCHLQLLTILGSMIQVVSLEKISYTYMLKSKLNRSLHQPHFCRFGLVLVLGITQFDQKCTPC